MPMLGISAARVPPRVVLWSSLGKNERENRVRSRARGARRAGPARVAPEAKLVLH